MPATVAHYGSLRYSSRRHYWSPIGSFPPVCDTFYLKSSSRRAPLLLLFITPPLLPFYAVHIIVESVAWPDAHVEYTVHTITYQSRLPFYFIPLFFSVCLIRHTSSTPLLAPGSPFH